MTVTLSGQQVDIEEQELFVLRLTSRTRPKIRVTRSGCWEWTGNHNQYGYGPHRRVYLALHGAIPTGLELDHLCRVRHCVNPNHMEPVTPRVNILRGKGNAATNAAKTHCPQGHPYSGANLLISYGRLCRACRNQKARERYQSRRKH